MKFSTALLALLSVITSIAIGEEYSPWYPPAFEIQPQLNLRGQFYRSLSVKGGAFKRASSDLFADGSIGIAIFNWHLSSSLQYSCSRQRSLNYDHFSLKGRYLLLDDVSAVDPVSVAIGLKAVRSAPSALRDVSSFHHGTTEAELSIATGKEFNCYQFWKKRIWGVAAIGIANKGSPWLYLKGQLGKNYGDRYHWELFLSGLIGLGSHSLYIEPQFRGYGSIAHRSIDLGFLCNVTTESGYILNGQVSYRLLARNFPRNALSLSLSLLYPFGL